MIVFSFLYGLKHLSIFQYNEFVRTMISKGKHLEGFWKHYFLEIDSQGINIYKKHICGV